ncbi:MAG TPA: tyrosine-protein phosphatase [Candidatus Limnocylindrales bacterium]|jgi:protein-tyrosine phosphatase|nr:tyrosine-protein phosphatase [Candidatus Limnocylindrales bacterium]
MTLDPATLATPSERHLPILGTRNLRDVGGYPAGLGRRTRWGTLFRGDCLDQLPSASQRDLIERGLRTVIDLRSTNEASHHPNVFQASSDVRYLNLPIFEEDPSTRAESMAHIYRLFLEERPDAIAPVVRALVAPGALPAIVHCAAGKDRTGIVIGLVLGSVGVPPETIAEDYGLTSQCFTFRWVKPEDAGAGVVAVLDDEAPLVDCPPEVMLETLDYLRQRYGGPRGYLLGAGVTAEELARLTDLLTEPDRPDRSS